MSVCLVAGDELFYHEDDLPGIVFSKLIETVNLVTK